MASLIISSRWELQKIKDYMSDVLTEYPEYRQRHVELSELLLRLYLRDISLSLSTMEPSVLIPTDLYRHFHSVPTEVRSRIERNLFPRIRQAVNGRELSVTGLRFYFDDLVLEVA